MESKNDQDVASEGASLPYASPRSPDHSISDLVTLTVRAMVGGLMGFFVWSLLAAVIVDKLPRSEVREAVTVPWGLCVGVYLVTPPLVVLLCLRRKPLVWRCVVPLLVAAMMAVLSDRLGMLQLLSKAYRRGL